VAVLRDASQAFATSLFAVMQAVAPSLGVEVIPVNMRDAGEIEQSVGTFARSPNGGLIPVASAAAVWTAPSRSAFAATDEYGRFAMPSAWR
jgi:putative ABC transport system substrate-binding protein